MRPRRLLTTLAALLIGCQGQHMTGGPHPPAAGTAPTAAERSAAIAAVDWGRAIDLKLELRDYGMDPPRLRLSAGQSYRLSILNSGGVAHYFNAPEFLGTIAARQVTVKDHVEVIAPAFSAFEVARRGGTFTVEFVPLVKGTYRMFCHLRSKEHMGVEGWLIVE